MKNQTFKIIVLVLIMSHFPAIAQEVRNNIEITSEPANSEVKLKFAARIQNFNAKPKHLKDVYDNSINSPKSVVFSPDGKKFYIHSLEGCNTSVYDAHTLKLIKIIYHKFSETDSALFVNNEHTLFDYSFKQKRKNYNVFRGKPVESCLSHNGKYMWVTYYRRGYDVNAQSPSALAIIDLKTDSIIRVIPTGPLPKMIACSPDNRFIAVTHWGDNTVGIIDIHEKNVRDFKYKHHCIIDHRANLNFGSEIVDRDQQCGNCLRGTVFTPDGKYLLVGKMGGSGGIAVFTTENFEYLGSVTGMKTNVRHLIISNNELILSANGPGFIQKCSLDEFIQAKLSSLNKNVQFTNWQNCHVGAGARTIDVAEDGKYIFVAVNNACKVAVVRSSDMNLIASIKADAYPVGMALSPDESKLIVTAQGKSGKGGNSVMIYEITRSDKASKRSKNNFTFSTLSKEQDSNNKEN